MSQETNDLTKKRIVYQVPAMASVRIQRDVAYRTAEDDVQTLDIYLPPQAAPDARLPAVVFVSGYRDVGMQKMLGCKLKEMASYVSWAQLVAASGMVAVTYTNSDPAADVYAVLRYVQEHAATLGIDESRLGVWACSGNVPNALSILLQDRINALRCAVLYYGLMLDLDSTPHVADAAKMFGFVNPNAGKTVADLPPNLPLFVVRAGQDEMPHLNETIDLFLAHAVAANLPVNFLNHPAAPHFFDAIDDSETTRTIIRQTLAFLRFHLGMAE
ncbi:MAG: alpha/beta hydrolase [Blastocatellia bacterium]